MTKTSVTIDFPLSNDTSSPVPLLNFYGLNVRSAQRKELRLFIGYTCVFPCLDFTGTTRSKVAVTSPTN